MDILNRHKYLTETEGRAVAVILGTIDRLNVAIASRIVRDNSLGAEECPVGELLLVRGQLEAIRATLHTLMPPIPVVPVVSGT